MSNSCTQTPPPSSTFLCALLRCPNSGQIMRFWNMTLPVVCIDSSYTAIAIRCSLLIFAMLIEKFIGCRGNCERTLLLIFLSCVVWLFFITREVLTRFWDRVHLVAILASYYVLTSLPLVWWFCMACLYGWLAFKVAARFWEPMLLLAWAGYTFWYRSSSLS